MNCRLCHVALNTSNKCDAHILPRSLLKAMSPEEYGKLLIVGTDMGKKKRAPTGSYDTEILCRTCDGKLGEFDKYALRFVNSSTLVDHPSGVGWIIKGVNQNKLKLFCISYLWRASITSRPEFRGVSLGAKHEEIIRCLLLQDAPLRPEDYSTVFAKFVRKDDNFGGVMFPAKTRINNFLYYEAYLPKLYKFWVKVDKRIDPVTSQLSLGTNPDMFVHNKGDFDTSRELGIMIDAARKSQ